jgi:hypothetical protein
MVLSSVEVCVGMIKSRTRGMGEACNTHGRDEKSDKLRGPGAGQRILFKRI